MITASVLVVVVAFGVAASALLGRRAAIGGLAGQLPLALPIIAVSSAVGLWYGMGLLVAIIATASVGAALLAPSLLPKRPPPDGGSGRATTTWVCGIVVSVALASLLLSWTASLIEFAAPVNRTVTVVVLAVAGACAAAGVGPARAWCRVLLYSTLAGAVLLVVAGIAAGAPASLTSPLVASSNDGLVPAIVFGVALVIIGLGHPGIRAAAVADRDSVFAAGLIGAIITGASLIGLLMLSGGWIGKASYPMFVILAFMPPVVGGIIAGLMALATVLGLMRALRDMWELDQPIRALVAGGSRAGSKWGQPIFRVVTVAVIAVIAIAPVPQIGVAIVAAVFAIGRLIANRELDSQTRALAGSLADGRGPQ